MGHAQKKELDIEQRMDPELWAVYKRMPIFDPDDVVAAGKSVEEFCAAASAVRLRSKRVDVRNLGIPGPQGAPPVPIRIYTPSPAKRDAPALLWIHGGGFTLGNLDQDDALCERLVEDVGCVVVSVDYRLAPEHPFPAGPKDCYAALRWLAGSSAELGVDPSRIAIGGQSAGGGLAAGVALMARDRREVRLSYQLLRRNRSRPNDRRLH